MICFSVPLFLINIYLREEVNVINAKIASYENTEKINQLNLMEKSFTDINNELIRINKISQGQVYWNNVLEEIMAIIPQDIQIFSLQIEPDGGMTIIGNAKSREDVLVFGKKLKSSSNFSDIKTPLDNLTKSDDIEFKFSGKILLDNFRAENISKKDIID